MRGGVRDTHGTGNGSIFTPPGRLTWWAAPPVSHAERQRPRLGRIARGPGEEEVKSEFVSEGWARKTKFRADSGNSGRVCFCPLGFSFAAFHFIPVGRSATGWRPHGNRAGLVHSALFLSDPLGSERSNRFVTPRRATVTSRRKQTNRSGGRCVPRAPPRLAFFNFFWQNLAR